MRNSSTVADEEDLVKVMRLDERDVMAGNILDSTVDNGNDHDGQSEERGDETGRGSGALLRRRVTSAFRRNSVSPAVLRSHGTLTRPHTPCRKGQGVVYQSLSKLPN